MIRCRVENSLVVGFTLLGLACGRRAEPPAARERERPASAGGSANCTSTVEADAFACSRGTASRSGDTLRLRLGGKRDTTFVNTHDEVSFEYRYVGRINPSDLHVVEQLGGERPPHYLLIHPRAGWVIDLPAMPVVAPDGARLAAATTSWDCSESPDQHLEIWRIADSIPVLEWNLNQLRCEAHGSTSGWAAIAPVWRGPDSLGFTKLEESPERRSDALAARDARGWHLVTPAAR